VVRIHEKRQVSMNLVKRDVVSNAGLLESSLSVLRRWKIMIGQGAASNGPIMLVSEDEEDGAFLEW
jgi:hypothetical protein